MCAPIAIAAVSLAVTAGGAIASHKAQAGAEKANREAAERARKANVRELGTQQLETQQAAAQNIFLVERQARTARSLASVGAGEAGVAGVSAQAVLDDITREAADVNRITLKQTRQDVSAQQRAKGAQTDLMLNRISQVGKPSALATGLRIAGSGLNFGQFLIRQAPPANPDQ